MWMFGSRSCRDPFVLGHLTDVPICFVRPAWGELGGPTRRRLEVTGTSAENEAGSWSARVGVQYPLYVVVNTPWWRV